MAGMIPQTFIETLRDRVDLAEIIGQRIPLKKSGGNYKACCPFHDERTPSFNVRPDKGFYHCFGCGAHGDAIAFLQEYENQSFTEAIEALAAHLGLEVPYDQATRETMKRSQSLTGALEEATRFYRSALREHPWSSLARDYLANRGVSEDMIERFALGFAPPEGDALAKRVNGETRSALLTVKALNERNGQVRDLFRNRLMFPIRNTRGRTVAFGGRTLGDDKAKYINSPESEVYHKSREIYGLYEARQASRQLDSLLVVEGYMDVIALTQMGISNAVAASGTATNEESLQTLLRASHHLVFCFDGDTAGYRAADRAMENLLSMLEDGMHIQFLMLPEGEDPDSLVRTEGGEAFSRRMEAATPLSRMLFERQGEGLNLSLAEHRGELRSRVEPMLRRMPRSAIRDALWEELQRLTRRPPGGRGDRRSNSTDQPHHVKTQHASQPAMALDRDTLLALALYYEPPLANEVTAVPQAASHYPSAHAFAQWLLESGIESRSALLAAMAFSVTARDRFAGLFNRIEHFPEHEPLLADARHMLGRARSRQQARQASEILAGRKPSELTEEERQELQRLREDRLRDTH